MSGIIVGNLCSLCAMVTDSISGTRKKNQQILALQSLSQVFYGVGSIILKGYSSTAQNVVAILRNFAAMKQIKSKVIEWTLVALGVVLGVLFNNRGLLGWLPIVANLEYSIAIFRFKNDERHLKLAFILNLLMYSVFSFVIQNYVGIVSNLVVAATTIVSLIRESSHKSSDAEEGEPESAERSVFSEEPYLSNGLIVLKKLSPSDADALSELAGNPNVYRYLPTFLLEQQFKDPEDAIYHLYDKDQSDSIILGVYRSGTFCGLAELYGYRPSIHKISVGYRLLEQYWGQGIATQTLGLLVDRLFGDTDIEIITASTMIQNAASANVLKKNGFYQAAHAVKEDWGYDAPTTTDKWIKFKPIGNVISDRSTRQMHYVSEQWNS